MIGNERQHRISKRRLAELRDEIREFDSEAVAERVGSSMLAAAELEGLRSEEAALADQVREYEGLRSGGITRLEAASLAELPRMLIQARIARRLSQRELGELVGLKEQQIQRYEAEEYSTANLRRLREIAEALRLRISETADMARETTSQAEGKREEVDWSKFPVKEMYRRHWFEGYSGSLDEAVRDGESLVADFVTSVLKKPAMALHRRRVRSGSTVDDHALLAWECRVLALAKKAQLKVAYRGESVTTEWIAELARSSIREDGPLRAKGMLKEVGVPLVVEPHLTGTHLDGAAFLYGDMPVLGMTLRYDRLDNFWFVLFHELFHVLKHLRKGDLEGVFDDLDASGDESIEVEADALAGEALVPGFAWNRALARYVRSRDSVVAFAGELEVNPAIVAGRVRHESKNYVILSDVVGQGEVRKLFPEVTFGT